MCFHICRSVYFMNTPPGRQRPLLCVFKFADRCVPRHPCIQCMPTPSHETRSAVLLHVVVAALIQTTLITKHSIELHLIFIYCCYFELIYNNLAIYPLPSTSPPICSSNIASAMRSHRHPLLSNAQLVPHELALRVVHPTMIAAVGVEFPSTPIL